MTMTNLDPSSPPLIHPTPCAADHYSKHSKLATVHLESCFLGVGGGKQIARALKSASTFYLRGNSVRDEGVKTIAAALAANSNVKTLALVDESIGTVGGLAQAF